MNDCIVCATRGGEGSLAVQQEAVRLAESEDKHLVFLGVVDPSELDSVDDGLRSSVKEELSWLGRALVLIAQKRAQLSGIQADGVIRLGDVPTEICRFLQEENASLLLLGAPRQTTTNLFAEDNVERFAADIEARTGVPVQVVRPQAAMVSQVEVNGNA